MTQDAEIITPAEHANPDRIATPRLVLRPPVYADGPALHALLSDPVACRFSPHAPIASLAVTRFLIAEWDERRAQGLRSYVVTYAERIREPFGIISIGADEELGGLIAPRESGRGVASEALRAVTDALRLRGTWTIIDAEHDALIQMLTKADFKLERRLPAYRVHPRISAQKRDCVLLRQTVA